MEEFSSFFHPLAAWECVCFQLHDVFVVVPKSCERSRNRAGGLNMSQCGLIQDSLQRHVGKKKKKKKRERERERVIGGVYLSR